MGASHPSRPPCRLRQKSKAGLQRKERSNGAVCAESRQTCQSGTFIQFRAQVVWFVNLYAGMFVVHLTLPPVLAPFSSLQGPSNMSYAFDL